jgi:hypothetical protein
MNLTEAIASYDAGEDDDDSNTVIRLAARGLLDVYGYAMFDENGERYEMGEGPSSHDICDRLSTLLESLDMEV